MSQSNNAGERLKIGSKVAWISICVNLILPIIKGFAGFMSGSVAIIADAANNLFDAVSSIVTLIAFKVSAKPADRDHPFGHGRFEYISGLFVAFLILLVGVEFLRTSVLRIMNPSAISFSPFILFVLIFSILVKLFLHFYQKAIAKKISSPVVAAASVDSLCDMFVTSVTLLAILLSRYTALPLDGYAGAIVSVFIIYSGVNAAKSTISPLLGEPPSIEFVEDLRKRLLSYEHIIGVHDIMVHDYGPGRIIATAHAEVPASLPVHITHDTVDLAEKHISSALSINLTLHMDPTDNDCEKTTSLKERALKILTELHPSLDIHDFRMVDGPTHTNLIFDVVVPFNCGINKDEIYSKIEKALSADGGTYHLHITFDQEYS